jgi:dTDP-4-amino-4,6-dideoxygalactose transaminase
MIHISKPYIGKEEKEAVLAVLESGMLAQGPQVAELERRFAELCQADHAVATSSGTTALNVALLAHEIGPGDEVITTPFTFIASVNTILYTGARPVLVDIEEDTFNIDPVLIEAAVTPQTKAIVPVHMFGYPCDMDPISEIAERYELAIIEDAAQAVGAHYKERPVGSLGDSACFSLYATKNVMSGEGGMITTNDADVAERARMIRSHGMKRRYYHDMLGYNFRLSDLHAAIGVVQMDRLEDFTAERKANAAYLSAHLEGVRVPAVKEGYDHVWHQYTIRIEGGREERDAAVQQLNKAGVGTGIFYPLPAHQQPYLQALGYDAVSLPVAERLSQEVLSLPVHPQLTEADLAKIVSEVNAL